MEIIGWTMVGLTPIIACGAVANGWKQFFMMVGSISSIAVWFAVMVYFLNS